MEATTLLPDPDLNKYWRWHWAVWMIVLCVPQFILALGLPWPAGIVLGISCVVFILIFILVRIYLPLYYDSLTYTLEDDLVVGTRGVFWKKRVTVPFRKITNIDISQGPVQRMFGLGSIHLQTAGAAGPQGAVAELRIEGMKDFEDVKDRILALLRAWHTQGTAIPPRDAASGTGSESPRSGSPATGIDGDAVLEELRAIRRLLERE